MLVNRKNINKDIEARHLLQLLGSKKGLEALL